MRVTYVGHEALTFSDYIDLEQGKTLHAEPGQVYDIAPASGRAVPEVPEPWFILAGAQPAPEAATESAPEPEPAPEPDEAQDAPETDPEPAPEPAEF